MQIKLVRMKGIESRAMDDISWTSHFIINAVYASDMWYFSSCQLGRLCAGMHWQRVKALHAVRSPAAANPNAVIMDLSKAQEALNIHPGRSAHPLTRLAGQLLCTGEGQAPTRDPRRQRGRVHSRLLWYSSASFIRPSESESCPGDPQTSGQSTLVSAL